MEKQTDTHGTGPATFSLARGAELERQFCLNHQIPLLPLSPETRLRSILTYRNDRRLFRRNCDATGEPLISCYHPETPFTIVKSEIWWGDNWDGIDAGLSPDFSKPFFPQFAELQRRVPREGTSVVNAENCEYNSHTRESKNCYLSHLAFKCEGALYSYWSVAARDILECSYTAESELCFSCSYVNASYDALYLEESATCTSCLFSYQLRGCKNCILCSNLVSKTYCIRNQVVSQQEFEAFRLRLATDPTFFQSVFTEFQELKRRGLHRAQHNLQCENVSGAHLHNCRDSVYCFDSRNAESCFNESNGGGQNIIHGYSVGFPESNTVYSSVTIRNSSDIFFCVGCWNSNNLWYCDNCVNCRDCFFCVGLKHRQYCFFNQQYSEEEFLALVKQAREWMTSTQEFGHFFPPVFSPFAYNESAAQDFFPLSEREVTQVGGYFRAALGSNAAHTKKADHSTTLITSTHPTEHPKPGDTWTCQRCALPYRFNEREIELYAQFAVPAPRECPDCRLTARLTERSPYSLFSRSCTQCGQAVESAEQTRPVVCDPCFYALTT